MPYKIRKRKCRQSDDQSGDYVVVKINASGKEEKVSCHKTKEKAQGAISAKHAGGTNEIAKVYICDIRKIIKEEIEKYSALSEGLRYHIDRGVGVDRNIFRPESESFFELFREVRNLSTLGLYQLNESERELIEETDIGEWGVFEGEQVPLDFPMLYEEDIDEAKYKGREVKLGKNGAKRGEGGKAYVYVRDPKTKKIRKVTFGSSLPDAMGDSDAHKKRRKSFGARHKCADKEDKTKPGYWACRATKMFGRNIAGWW